MHTVDLLEQALAAARRLGWRVREDWLDGNGGGTCYIKGQKWIFLDLAQSAQEHLAVACEALAAEAATAGPQPAWSDELRALVRARKAA